MRRGLPKRQRGWRCYQQHRGFLSGLDGMITWADLQLRWEEIGPNGCGLHAWGASLGFFYAGAADWKHVGFSILVFWTPLCLGSPLFPPSPPHPLSCWLLLSWTWLIGVSLSRLRTLSSFSSYKNPHLRAWTRFCHGRLRGGGPIAQDWMWREEISRDATENGDGGQQIPREGGLIMQLHVDTF